MGYIVQWEAFSVISICSKVCSSAIALKEWKCSSWLYTKLSTILSTDISIAAVIMQRKAVLTS